MPPLEGSEVGACAETRWCLAGRVRAVPKAEVGFAFAYLLRRMRVIEAIRAYARGAKASQ